ncbi:MAG: UDP-N-acetylglucosamine--N-acetylmuramyl-(pentapeptide) pyrophosphoryl-undecaprenol N-acetylglucosamine transferase [Patescibacteria group bacterium]|nr:UDP-N-acetylglucosamine--N-acetylmuramyl-(pentapeptide) pyrophosphoryl-undecaprenol N-acetylglucosamine transferase [Patescibacteria group bacterium]
MKKRILLTGGGTGGHIYPLLAVADEIKRMTQGEVEILYLGTKHTLNEEFVKRDIQVYRVASSKLRRYFALANFIDIPKFFFSFFQALFRLYFLMPDVIFSKGGPGALAVVLAARFYFIPVIIHESDAVPGLTNKISAIFTKRIFIAFKTAASYFKASKTTLVGNPIRHELFLNRPPDMEGAKARLRFDSKKPLVLFLGGSQGAARLNTFVFDNLEGFLNVTQVFHLVGEGNIKEAQEFVKFFFKDKGDLQGRYQFAGFLDAERSKIVLTAANVVVSRAGSGAIFEVASFGKPSILIPLPEAASDHQRINAYEYARGGAAVVIEETNFTFNVVRIQIENLLKDAEAVRRMSEAARNFAKPEAAEIIARQIVEFVR